MAEPYLGEIRPWAFAWAQTGWALCDGTTLTVQQNAALYSLIGNAFGGTPSTNFNLPDLRGRVPVGIGVQPGVPGPTYAQGNTAGAETVVLNITSVPAHTHTALAIVQTGTQAFADGNLLSNVVSQTAGSTTNFSVYSPPANWSADAALNSASVGSAGSGIGHNNMQPFTVVNFSISTSGYYPQRP
jgi:microcystin-dependent protein